MRTALIEFFFSNYVSYLEDKSFTALPPGNEAIKGGKWEVMQRNLCFEFTAHVRAYVRVAKRNVGKSNVCFYRTERQLQLPAERPLGYYKHIPGALSGFLIHIKQEEQS